MALASPPPSAPPSPPVEIRPYAFQKAQLGMDLAAWRATAPYRQAASCTAPSGAENLVRCRVADQPLGGGYKARDTVATFANGRLADVSFTASIDGFSYVVHALKLSNGDPSQVLHDQVRLPGGLERARVQMIWRNGRAAIRLGDPVGQGDRLGVRFSLDGAARSPQASTSGRG